MFFSHKKRSCIEFCPLSTTVPQIWDMTSTRTVSNTSPRTKLTSRFIQKVCEQTSHDSLMGHDQYVSLSLQLHYDRFESRNEILVALTSRISVRKLVRVTSVEIRRIFLLDLCICHFFANTLKQIYMHIKSDSPLTLYC